MIYNCSVILFYVRFSRKYIIPSFLHCHNEKPNMITYLTPLMKTLNSLYDKGITVKVGDQTILVKAQLLMASLDLPAKALVSNMKQFNGKFGCSVCLDEGKSRAEQAMLRYYPFEEIVQLRTHHSMVNGARQAAVEGHEINGIKGASPLMMLDYIDLPKCLVIDWMHGVLLGVTKAMAVLWFSSKNKQKKYFIGDKVELLDRRFLSIKIPDFISRRQRTLEDHKHWKASEMREWLIHFSVPVLHGILDAEPYFHHTLFVTGISTLVKDDLTLEDIDFAERCLLDFCKVYSEIYGEYAQTMNLHLVRHLPMFVRMYGPLFGYSCFGFESMNSFLKGMVHGTSHINKQISFAVFMAKELTSMVKSFVTEEEEKSKLLFLRLADKFIQEDKTGYEEICPLGKKTVLSRENEYFMLLPSDIRNCQVNVYNRITYKGMVYHSKDQQAAKTRNDYVCCFIDESELKKGVILSFLQYNDAYYAIVQEYKLMPFRHSITDIKRRVKNQTLKKHLEIPVCQHIELIVGLGKKKKIKCSQLRKKCILMEISNNKSYISTPPNILEHN